MYYEDEMYYVVGAREAPLCGPTVGRGGPDRV